jgi:hypothetical protein
MWESSVGLRPWAGSVSASRFSGILEGVRKNSLNYYIKEETILPNFACTQMFSFVWSIIVCRAYLEAGKNLEGIAYKDLGVWGVGEG